MPAGELYIRRSNVLGWTDAFEKYGVSFTDASLSRLMTPVPNKDAVENKSRLQHGKRVIRKEKYVRKEERDIALEMHIIAKDKADFWSKYADFCEDILDFGFFDVRHRDIANKVFRLTYKSCDEFSEFMQRLAKFTLTVNEPDPTNRGEKDAWNSDEETTTE